MVEGGRDFKKREQGSLAFQWFRLHASTAGGTGLIPGWGTKIPHATRCGQKLKKLKRTNEIMPFAEAWMDLEMIILSEVTERQIYDITYR